MSPVERTQPLEMTPMAFTIEGAWEILAHFKGRAQVFPCCGNGQRFQIRDESEALEKFRQAFACAPPVCDISAIGFKPLDEDS